ncbi:MAG TPA: HD domain-containing phosphohydrolase [Fimbriimonadales bacterium]|nr:HD domain-containing phosphohydrolase [Fimbriimonadales bacterium]
MSNRAKNLEQKIASEERDRFFTLALDMLCIANFEGHFKRINPAFEKTLGYTEQELLSKPFLDFVHPEDKEATLRELSNLSDGIVTESFENRYRCKDGTYKWLSWRAIPKKSEGLIYAVAREITAQKEADQIIQNQKQELERCVAERTKELEESIEKLRMEIEHRKKAEKNTTLQLERVNALRKIDLAITGSVDLRVILDVILDQVTSQLCVDAADVMLLNASNTSLQFAAGRGFRGSAIRNSTIRIGESYAGKAALERVLVRVNQLPLDTNFMRKKLVEEEGFVSYVCAPLLAKAKVKGVLEIFHREPLTIDNEWIEFLQTLANQATIAIENATMIEQLERQNTELLIAYEATLEGWAAALDLRDNETQGHTERVTEMTLRLADRIGVSKEQLIHIRRGALLHDIGKIGIPDYILLKPDKLTDEEMEIMKKHPSYAFQWLSPIRYLVPALDIPYCHHEKWDGTGYPRGLKGESIPLAARIFAVVDVFDALTSDRPYRKALPKEEALKYIIQNAGSHFDPNIVSAFLEMMNQSHSITNEIMIPPAA